MNEFLSKKLAEACDAAIKYEQLFELACEEIASYSGTSKQKVMDSLKYVRECKNNLEQEESIKDWK